MRHLNQIFDKLNLTKEKGLYLAGEDRGQLFSNRVERLINRVIKPDAFFCIDNKPFILFFENLGTQKKSKLKEIWNFNETPIVIVSEQDSVEIYNGFEYLTNKETLKLFGNEDKLNDFKYFEIVTGKTWEKYQSDFDSKHRIDFHLLSNIKSARDILISQSLSSEHANSLIGKIIFVRYLIDRKIKLDFEKKGKSRIWTNSEFCSILSDKNEVQKFFKYLKDKFNGDLFPLSKTDIESIPNECLTTLIELLSGDNVGTGQKSLFNLYDFSIIPVEFISNIYELFIGVDEQEKQGAYYTPLFLVDYILAETVEKKFANYKGYDCKVLDPACGSGIFLVETLRKIIEKYQANNPDYTTNIDQYKEDLKKLASDNIFGVDKDKSAINVAIFSIYLTLLDYQNPSDIENFKFPHLENQNFFVSDFFDTESEFNKVLRKKEFSFILGNPPWKGNGVDKIGKKYLSDRLEKEKKEKKFPIGINNGEIVEAFILRVSDFTKVNTRIALIVKSTILYNKGYSGFSKFRRYFLEEFFLEKILELAPVRFEVFDKSNDPAVAPASVLFYKYANGINTDENIIEHLSLKPSRFFSLFKVFSISRNDYQKVGQEKLKNFDWLWKILVYGSYLDFNLINRLKKEYISLNELLSNPDKFKKGTGVKFSSKPNEDSSHLVGKPFIDAKGVNAYFINPESISIFQTKKVGRKRDSILFKGPILLVRNGLDTQKYTLKAAIYDSDIVYRNSLTGVKPISSDSLLQLKNIIGNLHSDLYTYFAVHTFCSIGIEREQTKEYEKFDIPYVNKGLEKFVDEITASKKLIYDEKQKILTDDFKINIAEKNITENLHKINSKIYANLNIKKNTLESALIDFNLNISRPLMTRDKTEKTLKYLFEPLKADDIYIQEYVSTFLTEFNKIYERTGKTLIAELKHSSQIIGLFFKLIETSGKTSSTKYIKTSSADILKIISSLGNEQITNRLFVQKDIRGFEKDGFYIVKPNERKLWHKAIAHLDVNEFRDAILIAGKHTTLNV
ncbi:N-6 DNA methylase [uncultured Algibacter sp.]|uniref:HsdM family class I SAM-dependent methyltransferase n=1 Tax=uncultured Algibacter sp. TaxID=298659 RepID=UPI0026242D91|nr:N-6 DNA methylase [uncultured Algibacter sp.]